MIDQSSAVPSDTHITSETDRSPPSDTAPTATGEVAQTADTGAVEHPTYRVAVVTGSSAYDKATKRYIPAQNAVLTWPQITSFCLKKTADLDAKDGYAIVPSALVSSVHPKSGQRGTWRLKDNVQAVSVLPLDIENHDFGSDDPDTIRENWKQLLPGVQMLAWTSRNHGVEISDSGDPKWSPGHPRFRVLIPLARAVTPAEYKHLAKWALEALPGVDKCVKNAACLYHLKRAKHPAAELDGWDFQVTGAPLDPDALPGGVSVKELALEAEAKAEARRLKAAAVLAALAEGDLEHDQTAQRSYAVATIRGAAEKVAQAPDGERHAALTKAAWSLAKRRHPEHMPESEIRAVLTQAWDLAVPASRHGEGQRVIEDAMRDGHPDPGSWDMIGLRPNTTDITWGLEPQAVQEETPVVAAEAPQTVDTDTQASEVVEAAEEANTDAVEPNATPPRGGLELRNYMVVRSVEMSIRVVAPLKAILANLTSHPSHRIVSVSGELYAIPRKVVGREPSMDDMVPITTPTCLESWAKGHFAHVVWSGKEGIIQGTDDKGLPVSWGVLLSALRRAAERYDAVELYPHHVASKGSLYLRDVHSYPPPRGGETPLLDELCNTLNAASQADRELLRALVLTQYWGGHEGQRPMCVITSKWRQGSGKSQTAFAIKDLVGGATIIDNPSSERVVIKALGNTAQGRRVVILDNLKGDLSSASIESLITAPVLTVDKMYVGPIELPNRMTWIATTNAGSLSTDLAKRSVEILLGKPDKSFDFTTWYREWVETNREGLQAECLHVLRSPAMGEVTPSNHTRWQAWERGVLARASSNPDALLELIAKRRQAADSDASEAEDIAHVLEKILAFKGHAARSNVIIPTEILLPKLKEFWDLQSLSPRKMWAQLREVLIAERLRHCEKGRTSATNGLIWRGDDDASAPITAWHEPPTSSRRGGGVVLGLGTPQVVTPVVTQEPQAVTQEDAEDAVEETPVKAPPAATGGFVPYRWRGILIENEMDESIEGATRPVAVGVFAKTS